MKKTLGYFYKLGKESIEDALDVYQMSTESLHRSVEQVEKCIQQDKDQGVIDHRNKPKKYRLVVEEIE